jgi:seryl-tRNA synthetase
MQHSIPLPHQVDKGMAEELVKESVYVSRNIRSFAVDAEGKTAIVDITAQADQKATVALIGRYITAMLSGYRGDETTTVRHTARRDPGPIHPDVYQELKRRKWLFELGPGHVALAGPALRLTQFIDQYAARRYRDEYPVIERRFPALISTDLLAWCGYLESHPNLVTWVTHLVEDFDLIESFRQANLGPADGPPPDPQTLAPPDLALNPAACLPAYLTLQDEQVPAQGLTLSWAGQVFRYESSNLTTLERLWEFTVRELVHLAEPDQITLWRDHVVDLVCDIAAAFDLDMAVQLATDPFFATVAAAKRLWQQSMASKYEIRLTVGQDRDGQSRSIAAGSVNLHGAFFAERFGIQTQTGQPVATACVGLGIERWAFAIFAQHGFDQARWPRLLRDQTFADTAKSVS